LASEVRQPAIRRDRTSHFQSAKFARMREFRPAQNLAQNLRDECSPRGLAEEAEINSVYVRAIDIHASLASRLAQHNGIRQFGVENADRTPPIEFRLKLPELEAEINAKLEELLQCQRDLPCPREPQGHILQVRDNIQQWLTRIHDLNLDSFEEQRRHMQELAASSPKFSPTLCPMGSLGKQLAVVISSPVGSRNASPQTPELRPECRDWDGIGSSSKAERSKAFLHMLEKATVLECDDVLPEDCQDAFSSVFGALAKPFSGGNSAPLPEDRHSSLVFGAAGVDTHTDDARCRGGGNPLMEKPLHPVFSLSGLSNCDTDFQEPSTLGADPH